MLTATANHCLEKAHYDSSGSSQEVFLAELPQIVSLSLAFVLIIGVLNRDGEAIWVGCVMLLDAVVLHDSFRRALLCVS